MPVAVPVLTIMWYIQFLHLGLWLHGFTVPRETNLPDSLGEVKPRLKIYSAEELCLPLFRPPIRRPNFASPCDQIVDVP